MALQSGFVKVQSIEIPLGKHLIPQFLFVGDRVWRPCSLPSAIVCRVDENRMSARLAFESEMNAVCWIRIDTLRHRCIHLYGDRSALYECDIEDFSNLNSDLSFEHKNYKLKLFHHTKTDVVPLILDSGRLLASRWNYEGTKQFDDTHFMYFTDVAGFNDGNDLRSVAMSDGGFKIALQYDQPSYGIEVLDVPERKRGDMDAKIELYVDPCIIEQQPMLYHDATMRGEGVGRYWELLHQHIFRVPVQPGGSIRITGQNQSVSASEVEGLRPSDRILAGCAFEKGQMRAVFDEKDTGFKITHDTGTAADPIERFLEC